MSFASPFEHTSKTHSLELASRFDALFAVYGLSLSRDRGADQRCITLVARSPLSAAAQSIAANLPRFERGTVKLSVIFAQIGPVAALKSFVDALIVAGCGEPETVIRWARNRALLDAHERLTLGRALCWTGDSMRRSEDAYTALDRVDDANPVMLREAHASFKYLWKASNPLPKTSLVDQEEKQRHTSDGVRHPSFQSHSTIDQNVVSLESYFRPRRH